MGDGALRRLIHDIGYHRDTALPPDLFDTHRDSLHAADISLYDAPSYRDDRARWSVHATDHRRADTPRDGIIAHLEWFNPEHHPVLHALVDFPLWFLWNRILRSEPDTRLC